MKQIMNPGRAFRTSGDPTDGDMPQTIALVEITGAVAVNLYDALCFSFDETNRLFLAEPWDTNASGQSVRGGAGVAQEAGVAGDVIQAVVFGFSFVNISTGTATRDLVAVGSTTAGIVTEATPDATTVAGTILGKFLGNEDGTTNTAPLWVCPM
jgi:hypothetical protein